MMHDRCRNPNDERFAHYGGRGIEVCERWNSFENFLLDMGKRPQGTSIDRINADGNYEPGNCRWATAAEQTRNRRCSILVNWGGETLTLKECCRIVGEDYQRARRRVRVNGWDPISAVAGELLAYG